MSGIFDELVLILMDNSFDLFSNSICDRDPYISPFYPIHSIEEPYNIGLINCPKK